MIVAGRRYAVEICANKVSNANLSIPSENVTPLYPVIVAKNTVKCRHVDGYAVLLVMRGAYHLW